MKLLAIHPGSSFATADVYNGLVPQIEAQGHEVIRYELDARIDRAGSWLRYNWHRTRRTGRIVERPTPSDVQFWAGRFALEAALWNDVDWVLIFSAMYFSPDVLLMMLRAGRKVAIVFSESPYDDAQQMRLLHYCHVAFTNERTSVAPMREHRPQTYYLPHAYDPEKHHPEPSEDEPDVPSHDVVFVGTAFQERIDLLSAVDWSGIDLGLYGNWELLGSRNRLRQYVQRKDAVDNAETAALYRHAKIGLNLHRTSKGFGRKVEHIDYAESLNPRAYELAACGVFQISDARAELAEVLPTVPTFQTPAELESLIRRSLPDPVGRAYSADFARLSVQDHTFADRAKILVGALDAYDRQNGYHRAREEVAIG